MANPFVDFLNTLHNESASNPNAIAESQIGSPFFAEMQVKRDIIGFLKAKLEHGDFVILTGHAGDGKTTLLAQVLEALGITATKLSTSADIAGTISLHYVKDFSELTKESQDQELRHCFQCGGASFLIANTGPLLNAFKRLMGDDCESSLLEAMDSPAGQEYVAEGFGKAFILNIARVENLDFIRPFIDNMLAGAHWSVCSDCPCAANCPMYCNWKTMTLKHDRAVRFIENVYTWLQEYDMRATIRQMSAHLAFSMTGGLNCNDVIRRGKPIWKYDNLFSNLFFGSRGANDIPMAKQIRGIQLIQDSGLDRKSTPIDYALFVRSDVDRYFQAPVYEVFKDVLQNVHGQSAVNLQKTLKRAYLLFGENEPEKDQAVMKRVFSEWFDIYMDIRRNGTRPSRHLKNDVCHAINTLFVGDSMAEDGNHINLTLRRNNEQISNVQVLQGRISIDEVKLSAVPEQTVHQGGLKSYRLELQIERLKPYVIRLPLLNYFYEIKNGVIMTDIDPLLSNGIDSLKAQLLSLCNADDDSDEVTLVYMAGDSWKKQSLTIGSHTIDH